MDILGDSGIKSNADGMWPGASYPSKSEDDREVVPIGQQMHKAQAMVHYLNSVVLPDLYGQLPVNAEHISTVKRLRSDYRNENRKLEDKLMKQKIDQGQDWVRPRWTLAG